MADKKSVASCISDQEKAALDTFFWKGTSPLQALQSLCPCDGKHKFRNDCSLSIQMKVLRGEGEMKGIISNSESQFIYVRSILQQLLQVHFHGTVEMLMWMYKHLKSDTAVFDSSKYAFNSVFRQFFSITACIMTDGSERHSVRCRLCNMYLGAPSRRSLNRVRDLNLRRGMQAFVEKLVVNLKSCQNADFADLRKAFHDFFLEMAPSIGHRAERVVHSMMSDMERFLGTLVTHLFEHQSIYSLTLVGISDQMALEALDVYPPRRKISPPTHHEIIEWGSSSSSSSVNSTTSSFVGRIPLEIWVSAILPCFQQPAELIGLLMQCDRELNRRESYNMVWRKLCVAQFPYLFKDPCHDDLIPKICSSSSEYQKYLSSVVPLCKVRDWGKQFAVLQFCRNISNFDCGCKYSDCFEDVSVSVVDAPNMASRTVFDLSDYMEAVRFDSRDRNWVVDEVSPSDVYDKELGMTKSFFSKLKLMKTLLHDVTVYSSLGDQAEHVLAVGLSESGHFVDAEFTIYG